MRYAPILLVLTADSVLADAPTISPDGIDSKATGLTGARIEIGQIEPGRSAKPNYGIPAEAAASNTNPEQVYFRTNVAQPNEANEEHATLVAGMMIGTADFGGGAFEGVAPEAKLHSVAVGEGQDDQLPDDVDVNFALAADPLARISGPDPNAPGQTRRMRAINMSATK